MALETFVLQPSADIHLTPTQDVQVQVLGFDNAASIANPITSQCTYSIADPGIVAATAGGLLTAVGLGITFMTVEHTATGLNVVARVWVHNELDGIFLASKRGSVNVGADNFQPKIAAVFDGLDSEDVTGHPYVTYQSLAPAIFSVDAVTGRVRGIAPGNGALRILNATSGATIGDLPISVGETIGANRNIVEQLTIKGTGPDKRNILFLAEGFSAAEEDLFRDIVTDVEHQMRTSRLHEPYRLLSDDYNTWLAFEESGESGVSVGPVLVNNGFVPNMIGFPNKQPATPTNMDVHDLINLVGMPIREHMTPAFDVVAARTQWAASFPSFTPARLEPDVFLFWKFNTKAFSQMFDKDSRYGFMYGLRLGDRAATKVAKNADNRWYLDHQSESTFFFKDTRKISTDRMPETGFSFRHNDPVVPQNWSEDMFTYLASLRRVSAGTPLFNVGDQWARGGPDQGLVVIIVNDEIHGGVYKSMPGVLGLISAGRAHGFTALHASPDGIVDHTPDTTIYLLAPLVSYVIHELSHGFFLGDEYEDTREQGHGRPANLTQAAGVELSHNLNSLASMAITGLKWSSLLRVEKSSALLTEAVINAGALTIQFDLFPGEAGKWALGDDVSMVSKNLNFTGDFDFFQPYNSHKISLLEGTVAALAGNSLTLNIVSGAPGADDSFPKGSMLFVAKQHNGSNLSLTLPGVISWMNTPPGTSSLGMPAVGRFLTDKVTGAAKNCAKANEGLVNTPHPISGTRITRRRRHWLVGAHEGGGTFNCDVVRPSATCKMRNEYWYGRAGGHFRFCHVCRYFIVQEINASRHADLDRLYPGDPT